MILRWPILARVAVLLTAGGMAWADAPVLPGEGFTASHYQVLWTKSPFAVATPENVSQSPDYSLVGIAQFDGVSYASLIDKQNQKSFLVTSGKPAEGLTLVSVSRGQDASDMSALFQKDGQSITLKLEQPSAAPLMSPNGVPPMPAMNAPPIPIVNQQVMQIPGSGTSGPQAPPSARIHPRLIRLPPRPQQ